MSELEADEINLFDLMGDLKKHWKLVVGFTAVGALLAVLVFYLQDHSYTSSIEFSPSDSAALLTANRPIQSMNSISNDRVFTTIANPPGVELKPLETQAMFDDFSKLTSQTDILEMLFSALVIQGDTSNSPVSLELSTNERQLILQELIDAKLATEQNIALFKRRFQTTITVPDENRVDQKSKAAKVTVMFTFNNPRIAAKVLNAFGELLIDRMKQRTERVINDALEARRSYFDLTIDNLRTSYYARKEQRLLKLKEAVSIAQTLKQDMPYYSDGDVILCGHMPLFTMGTQALQAEIQLLQARSLNEASEDPYIDGLSPLVVA